MNDVSPWWFLVAAAAMAAYWVVQVFGAHINTKLFVQVLQKILREKNVVRAIKLCTAASNAPVGVATKEALITSVSSEEDEIRPVGYRGNRPVSMDRVRARIRARYDEAFTRAAAPLLKALLLALPSFFLCPTAVLLTLSHSAIDWRIVGASGAGFLFLIYVGYTHWQIMSSRNTGFDLLWPSFEFVYENRKALVSETIPPPPPPEAPPMATKNARLTLEVLEPGKPLRSLTLDGPVIKIGTFASAQVQLSAEGVSRMHAVVEIADGEASIIDLGASNPTRVNGEKVAKRALSNGDVIGIGDAELVVRLSTAGE